MKRIILKIFLLSFYIGFSVGKNEIECGTNTRTSKLGKLIGGRPSHPNDWPWMAALLKVNDSTLVCGGVLITDRYVLTAANCFNDFEIRVEQMKVRLGEYDFGTTNESNYSEFRIESLLNPNYNSDTRDNDIALLRLERPTSFSEFISPVCLPPRFETFETFETRRGTVVGWGTQEVGGNSSNILREISIPILRREDCESSFLGNLITPNMFCASQKGLDSCQGDSGGPLMIQQDDSRWYVVGIVSWGIGCALDTPGVYTKVNNYINWIRRNIEIPKTTLSPLTIYETEVKKVCGFNDKKSNVNRIIGGKPANPKDWPWMAALLKKEDESFFCGGVLITDRHILTAAHCLQIPHNKMKVRLGEYDFGTSNESKVSDFNIEKFFYPNYNLRTGDNDIGLLKLERPTSFGDFISPVCLSPRFETFENRLGIVIGWGTQQYGGTYSNILREVMIKILKRSECEAAFPGFNPITPNMFCAGLGGGDSCQGDSGGPFLIQEPDSRWYVVGIVSRGIGCGELNHPGVYTKINNYLDWIENRIQF